MPNYSPIANQNKGYESAGQEKSNLMNDNPIASRASGGSFMSKHSQSRLGGSPLMQKFGGNEGDESDKTKLKVKEVKEDAKKDYEK